MTYQDGFETLAIHAGQEPDPVTGAVVPPIYQVSTYKQDGVGGLRGGYEYSRSANPTRTALEQCLAALEGGARGLAFASGMAAEDCLLRTVCSPGDHVLMPDDAYGGTYRLFARVFAGWGLTHDVVPISHVAAVRASNSPPGRPRWCGPRRRRTRCWASPTSAPWPRRRTRPARCSWWTTRSRRRTCSSRSRWGPTWWSTRPPSTWAGTPTWSAGPWWSPTPSSPSGSPLPRTRPGGVAGPFDSWLTLRGVKTLAARMDRHCRNAMRVAQMLAEHPAVSEVLYPGLPSHPGHKTAQEQMRALRRHGVVPAAGRRGGRGAGLRPDPAVHPGRVARRGGVADRAPRRG